MPYHPIWKIDPVLISIGPLSIRWYGLFFALAFIFGISWMQHVYKKNKKKLEDLDPLLYYIMIGVIIGARLGHCLFYDPAFYFKNPVEFLKIWEGGLGSHGGFTGFFIAIYLYSKKYNYSFFWITDQISIAGCMAAFFIRLGNFFNSELVGIETKAFSGIIFARYDNLVRHPVQLYESLAYLLIAFILFIAWKAGFGRIKMRLISIALILANLARIFLESFKTKQESFDLSLQMGQLLSIPFLICGIVLFILSFKIKRPS